MCGAYKAYIHRATPAQATCPFSCCDQHRQPQTLTHLFLDCPVAIAVTSWLCRLWQAVTSQLPVVSAATMLAAKTVSDQCSSASQLQAWHRLRLAVLHNIWGASQVAQTQRSRRVLPDAAPSTAHTPSSSSSSSSSSTAVLPSSHGHLASRLALKTITAMIQQDWVKVNDNVRLHSGVCSDWLRGRDPSMTLQKFRELWCHNNVLASVAQHSSDGRLELRLHLSASCLVSLL